VFEDIDKAEEVAAAVHKQLGGDDQKKMITEHVEVQETKNAV
jgi:hypothetical protein